MRIFLSGEPKRQESQADAGNVEPRWGNGLVLSTFCTAVYGNAAYRQVLMGMGILGVEEIKFEDKTNRRVYYIFIGMK